MSLDPRAGGGLSVGAARRVAGRLVQDLMAADPGVLGAFCTGSTVGLDDAAELGPHSDVDVCLVLEGSAGPRTGKRRVEGVRLDLAVLSWAEMADPAVAVRTHWLAPGLAAGVRLGDRDGRLTRLQRDVAASFADPRAVWDRYESVRRRMAAGLDAPTGAGSWAAQVLGWVFPASLGTHLVLVADGRNPTVRLRYLRARETLAAHGLEALYAGLLADLGCTDVGPGQVLDLVPAAVASFDAAATRDRSGFTFAADLTPDSRPVLVEGTEALVAAGDHREAVWWLVVTWARSVQVLLAGSVGGPEDDRHAQAFAAGVEELLGLRTPADLRRRTAQVRARLPAVTAAARVVAGVDEDRSAGAPGGPGWSG
ncbi:MAG: hypothetical protein JWP61_1736 [Friedmanniella sp.]|nr:hypothetical protein [Friedmanniella sp.]